jgi:hypothetical protein
MNIIHLLDYFPLTRLAINALQGAFCAAHARRFAAAVSRPFEGCFKLLFSCFSFCLPRGVYIYLLNVCAPMLMLQISATLFVRELTNTRLDGALDKLLGMLYAVYCAAACIW